MVNIVFLCEQATIHTFQCVQFVYVFRKPADMVGIDVNPGATRQVGVLIMEFCWRAREFVSLNTPLLVNYLLTVLLIQQTKAGVHRLAFDEFLSSVDFALPSTC